MFDISFSELMLIGVIALIVIGPERLPKVARTVGHLLGRAQRYVNEVKSDIQNEMDMKEIGNIKKQMEDAAKSVKSSVSASVDEVKSAVNEPADSVKSSLEEARQALNINDSNKQKPTDKPVDKLSDISTEKAAAEPSINPKPESESKDKVSQS